MDRGVPEIRQSLAGVRVWRQQDPIMDALVVLVFKLGQNRVSNERKVEVEGKVQKKDREGIVAHQEPAASSSSISDAMVSSCGSLTASLLGFWGGKRERTEEGMLGVDEG
jgi:hypothetical protein